MPNTQSEPSNILSLDNILAAKSAVDRVFLQSPCYASEALGRELNCSLYLKLETQNPIHSFKGRGADWWMQQNPDVKSVACISAGNFGQAMAYAGRKHSVAVHVFTIRSANPAKIDAMRALGATVYTDSITYDDARDAAQAYASETGAHYILDGREPAIAEGAGTIGAELLDAIADLDTLFIPIGDGALIGGVATWIKHHQPSVKIIGVCAEGAPAMHLSWQAGSVVATDTIDTISDGIAINRPISQSVATFAPLVDDVVLVSDAQTIAAMRLLYQAEHIISEPAAAVSLAAAMELKGRIKNQKIAVIVTGSNADPSKLPGWLSA